MSLIFTLSYIGFSVIFILVMVDADGPYIMIGSLALLLLNFVGPSRMTLQDLQAEVPKSQYWWLIIFFAALVVAPFYRVSTGIDLLSIPNTSIKIVISAIWVGLTLLFVYWTISSFLRNKA